MAPVLLNIFATALLNVALAHWHGAHCYVQDPVQGGSLR